MAQDAKQQIGAPAGGQQSQQPQQAGAMPSQPQAPAPQRQITDLASI